MGPISKRLRAVKDWFGGPVAPSLSPPKQWLRYSNHLMSDGRVVGHAGYGGQFLLVDTKTKTSCAFLSVLENEAGYDDDYMGLLADTLRAVCCSAEVSHK